MKAKPLKRQNKVYKDCSIEEATHIELNLPGPIPTRILPIMIGDTRKSTGNWTWNGDIDNPTIKPSIKTEDGVNLCHTFVNNGKVQFLNDCTHEHKGKTLDLLDVD